MESYKKSISKKDLNKLAGGLKQDTNYEKKFKPKPQNFRLEIPKFFDRFSLVVLPTVFSLLRLQSFCKPEENKNETVCKEFFN